MNPKKLFTGAIAVCLMAATFGDAFAISYQQQAYNYGALRFWKGGADLSSDYACQAEACRLPAAQTTSIADINAKSSIVGFTRNASFFEATNYKGAFDPNVAVKWWETNNWTLSDGPDSLIDDGNLHHPLQAEIVGGSLAPAAIANTAQCETAFFNDGTAQIANGVVYGGTTNLFGVNFPVCVVNTTIMPTLLENATMGAGIAWLITGGDNLQIGTGDAAGVNTNATGCNGTGGGITSATLTMQPGTQVFGDASTTPKLNGIEVTRGSQLIANGTSTLPIVLSSADGGNPATATNDFNGVEEFAGVILDGCGIVNSNPGGDVASEAVQTGETRFFGGNVPADSSGSMQYVIIAESGAEFRPDEEVQGLTLEGVGAGTVLDHIQIHYSGDDGIEWFGGTVNAKHLVISVMADDGLDMDLGYQGFIQYALVKQSTTLGERGIESDNSSATTPDTLPRTMPTLSNISILGAAGAPTSTSTGVMMREGMGGFFDKVVVADRNPAVANLRIEDGCIDMDAQSVGAVNPLALTSGSLKWRNSHFNCTNGSGPVSGPLAGDPSLENDDDGVTEIYPAPFVVSSIAPLSRFVDATGSATATYFMNLAQLTGSAGEKCLVKPFNGLDAFYSYQTIDAAGMLVGTVNTPVDVASGVFQGYVIGFDPTVALSPANIEMQAYCENTGAGDSIATLNQPVLGANAGPTIDVVTVLSSTTLPLNINGSAILASGTVNAGSVGGGGAVTVSTTLAAGQVATNTACFVCEQNPGTGACLAPFAPTVNTTYASAGQTKPFAIACTNLGGAVSNNPAVNRITLNFTQGGILKGQGSFDTFTN